MAESMPGRLRLRVLDTWEGMADGLGASIEMADSDDFDERVPT
jgi:hypothetical protein